MTPERWRQIDALYIAAKERQPGERNAFLVEACADDSEPLARRPQVVGLATSKRA